MPTLPADSSTQPTTLIRETTPPSGKTASPVGQYVKSGSVYISQGTNGGMYVIPAGYDGSNYQHLTANTNGHLRVSRETYAFTKTTTTQDITATNAETITLSSTTGYHNYVYFIGFRVDAPDGAGSGTHSVNLYWGDSDEGTYTSLSMAPTYSVAYNANIVFRSSGTLSDGVFTPNRGPLFVYGASDDERCRVHYVNNTNVTQSQVRTLYLGYVAVPDL